MEHTSNYSSKKQTSQKTYSLVLLNDDFNDFDHVIDCLVLVCNHTLIQAEQCALITHYSGMCVVKEGLFIELLKYKKDLTLYGIDLEIRW